MADWEAGILSAFSPRSISLDHNNPDLFVTAQWVDTCSCWRLGYVAYRIGVAVFWSVILILSLVTDVGWMNPVTGGLMWFLYLTNWALVVLTIDVCIQALTSLIAWLNWRKWQMPDTDMTVTKKIQWVISNIALCTGLFVTIVESVIFYSESWVTNLLDVVPHFLNSVYLIFNLFVTAMPLRTLHFLHTTLFFCVFIVVSAIIEYATGVAAYPPVSWLDPLSAALFGFIGGVVGVALLWFLLYALYRLRVFLAGVKPGDPVNLKKPDVPYDPYNNNAPPLA